jgi:hypothetical protein
MICSRTMREPHDHGPDADVFCLSKSGVRQFNFASFLFPHEVYKINSNAL